MFTGIVEGMGRVLAASDRGGKHVFRIEAPPPVEPPTIGDSIAVNGVCLTAVAVEGNVFEVEAVQETLDRTNLGALSVGDAVDLERPLRADGRFDGHIVQGHVDGIGIVRSVTTEGDSRRFWFDAPQPLHRYLVEKGSITVDGVSLTVSGVDDAGFEVALIPYTLEVTVLGDRDIGDPVNLEVDVLAKYVERLMEGHR
jgi:riboflavin synthase